METAEKRVTIASSSQRKRKRRKIRRIIRKRRRRNEKLVTAPSSLPNDAIEEIFLRLPVKALIRLKSLSKQWRVAIESLSFAERHLKIAEQHRVVHPKVMVITDEKEPGWTLRPDTDIGFRTFCLESGSTLSFSLINFPQGFFHCTFVSENCDGLFCIHSPQSHSVYVVNPATRWLRQLPPSRFQISMHKFYPTREEWRFTDSLFHLAFVKAAAGYKLVWLYNCENYNADASFPSEGVTKCEVFDFRANTWRYLSCTPKDTWEKIFSIDLISCHSPRTEIRDMFEWSHKDMVKPSTPVAVCKNKKILLSHRCSRDVLRIDRERRIGIRMDNEAILFCNNKARLVGN
ncbi:hypothetical protein YC2023_104067 [Brassica napus]